MKLSELDLMRVSAAYIKDGYLKKWRYDSDDKREINHRLNVAMNTDLLLTEGEINYIRTVGNVIIEENGVVEFINFNGILKNY